MNVKDATQKIELLQSNAIKQREVSIQKIQIEDQGLFITETLTVIKRQSDTIDKYEETIKMQENILNQLINYLKSIDQWPPKIPKVNPDNWT